MKNIDFIKNKKIYLLRHGETEFNREGRCQGVLNSNLTEKGIEQVKINGCLLKYELRNINKEDIIMYSSPLGRTVDSTEIILREIEYRVSKVVYEDNLKEGDLGIWGGQYIANIKNSYKNIDYSKLDWYFNSPKGEGFEDIKIRCEKFVNSLEDIKEGNIIIMSHGLLGIVLRSYLLQITKKEAVSQGVPQNGFYLIYNNELKFISSEYDEY